MVAILDERAGIGGKYHDAALAALRPAQSSRKLKMCSNSSGSRRARITFVKEEPEMYLMRNHDVWIYVRCANRRSVHCL